MKRDDQSQAWLDWRPPPLKIGSRILLGIFLLIAAFSLSGGCQRDHNGAITVAGSTSVEPFAELLAEEYMNRFPGKMVYVQGGGSTAGIQATLIGAADIGMSSRPLEGPEKKLYATEIARDAIALIVNPENPVSNLSVKEVQAVFSGQIRNWKEVGGPDHQITLVTREEGSGTRGAFQELIMGNDEIDLGAIVQDSNGAVRQLVSSDPHSIGYISLGLVDEGVKALKIDGVFPDTPSVIKGEYQLVRPFLFLVKDRPEGNIQAFIDFALSPEGQMLLSGEGLISVKPLDHKGGALQ
jgi:phosphate transport system substrate-binding protein